ncbi:MAG: SIS domain-containing protein [Bacteroidota bacterium]
MPLNLYKQVFENYFSQNLVQEQINQAIQLVKKSKRIFFIGNGGSNSICSHMMEDYMKIAGYPTFAFSDAALITCYANDYGYENAMAEWLKIHFNSEDLLVAISSSGKSLNILNAVETAKSRQGNIITLSGFKEHNPLSTKGDINFHIAIENFGIVECYHQIILHVILDSLK